MAATGIGNPLGAVVLFDAGAPKIVSGKARASAISGGVFVFGSTSTGVVGSQAASYATADILFAKDASGAQFNGIVMQTVGSNQPVAVATDGVFLLTCSAAVDAGSTVLCDGSNAVEDQAANVGSQHPSRTIGRALTAGASGGYAVIQIRA